MKLKELYALPPISVSHDFSQIFEAIKDLARINSSNPVFKLVQFCTSLEEHIYSIDNKIDSSRFQVNIYLDEGDDKYGARLFTVIFDNIR